MQKFSGEGTPPPRPHPLGAYGGAQAQRDPPPEKNPSYGLGHEAAVIKQSNYEKKQYSETMQHKVKF